MQERVFIYIHGCEQTDIQVGRVLGGWPRARKGGMAPQLELLSNNDTRQQFEELADYLYPSTLEPDIRRVFLATLMVHHAEFTSNYPTHLLTQHVAVAAKHCFIEEKLFLDICSELRSAWYNRNIEDMHTTETETSIGGRMDVMQKSQAVVHSQVNDMRVLDAPQPM